MESEPQKVSSISNSIEGSVLCPSAQCEDNALLLGIIDSNGHVSFIKQKVRIDKEFVEIAHRGRSPEKRFRFANTCVKKACKHWEESRCKVIDTVIDILKPVESSSFPSCPIRSECRWFSQIGGKACNVCPMIITDLHHEE